MRSKKNGGIYIGTSGWSYKDWHGRFYPETLKKDLLPFYSQAFSTVEVNSSFYHLPLPTTFAKWQRETPAGFRFSVKLSKFITHQKQLAEIEEPLGNFLRNAAELGRKLRIILVQLPPKFPYDLSKLAYFFATLRSLEKEIGMPRTDIVFEPRHPSWFAKEAVQETKKLLHREKSSFVLANSAAIPSYPPEEAFRTASFVYLRFHGPGALFASGYGEKGLKPLLPQILAWLEEGIDVYAYFNNDINGHAIEDARTLLRLLGSS